MLAKDYAAMAGFVHDPDGNWPDKAALVAAIKARLQATIW